MSESLDDQFKSPLREMRHCGNACRKIRAVWLRFELCNATQGLIKFHGNITKEKDGNQYLTADLMTPISWDDNIGSAVSIQSRVTGETFMELFVIREKNLCKAANIYLGEFWYALERAFQMPVRSCPISAGRYHARRAKLDFDRITLQTFPFGRLRFIMGAIDHKSRQNIWCLLVEVDNPQN
ncbi:hypothetical protein ILUMI_21650 [Ignelater luminosus]|uniref:Uncharacterized protein n=1 Tax=Ignelater luminosus TaxID=2038154 RepID=A0A8K0G3I6_IGNLU|nr:hypothetical protein ILUMI_21650 [Ignelater luminosus]